MLLVDERPKRRPVAEWAVTQPVATHSLAVCALRPSWRPFGSPVDRVPQRRVLVSGKLVCWDVRSPLGGEQWPSPANDVNAEGPVLALPDLLPADHVEAALSVLVQLLADSLCAADKEKS